MDTSIFILFQLLLVFVPAVVITVLVIYALILAIRALRIYINKNS